MKEYSQFHKKLGRTASKCIVCANTHNKKYVSENKVSYFFSRSASEIRRRTDPDRCPEKSAIYTERGIKCLLGTTTKEVSSILSSMFYEEVSKMIEAGEKPSIDRVDPCGHYEVGNIRIITYKENVAGRNPSRYTIRATKINGDVSVFESISEAANVTGSSRTTIRNQINASPVFNKRGIKFERVV